MPNAQQKKICTELEHSKKCRIPDRMMLKASRKKRQGTSKEGLVSADLSIVKMDVS